MASRGGKKEKRTRENRSELQSLAISIASTNRKNLGVKKLLKPQTSPRFFLLRSLIRVDFQEGDEDTEKPVFH